MIKCVLCHDDYKPVAGGGSKQGINCTSNTLEHDGAWYLWAHYGSDYDGKLWKMLFFNTPDWLRNADPVCDECIKALLEFPVHALLELVTENAVVELPW